MNDFTLVEKLKILMDVILSSPLFLLLIICAVIISIFLIFKLSLEKKSNRIAFISCWVVMLITIFVKYINIFFELIDNMFNMIFEALYFPSLSVYLVILIISNFFLIYSVIPKKADLKHKVLNISSAVIIDTFLIFTMELVNQNNISVYDRINLYSNGKLLVLLQLTMSVFTSWLLLNLLISAHNKLKKFDKEEIPELIFDE
jgi:hypothetical protein